MKLIYEKLMKQYGGSIPFSAMKRASKPKKTKRRPNKKKRTTKKRTKQKLSSKGYYPGTIIRKSGKLLKLNKDKKWIKL
tara:strand:- start:23 stop:259 length:237 start_codon:yes stop_codon:yes gene_type:complete